MAQLISSLPSLACLGLTIKGCLEAAQGKIFSGSILAISGMSIVNATTPKFEGVIHASIIGGSISTAMEGLRNIASGYSESNLRKAVTGALQLAVGGTACCLLSNMPVFVAANATQCIAIGALAGAVAYRGIKKMGNGQTALGMGQTLLGIAGVATAGFAAYSDLTNIPDGILISAELNGGLGNQLFQIATAHALALDLGGKAIFPNLPIDHVGTSPVLSRIDRFKSYTPPLTPYEAFKLEELKQNPRSATLAGHFESFRRFNHRRKEIVELFKPPPETTQYLTQKYKDLLDQETVAIHVRRGDYLNFNHNGELVYTNLPEDTDYYTRAVTHFDPKKNHFVVFSNDLPFAKNMPALKNLKHVTFVEGNQPHEDFYLMSMCKHHIIANSSFSSWAAYLAQNLYKKVICPLNWVRREFLERFFPNEINHPEEGHGQLPLDGWIQV